jgi:hypothetical protein
MMRLPWHHQNPFLDTKHDGQDRCHGGRRRLATPTTADQAHAAEPGLAYVAAPHTPLTGIVDSHGLGGWYAPTLDLGEAVADELGGDGRSSRSGLGRSSRRWRAAKGHGSD